MSLGSNTPAWQGVINPARLLTAEEIELHGEECHDCGEPAVVVEAHQPLTPEQVVQPLDAFNSWDLRFTCEKHAPIEAPDTQKDQRAITFYRRSCQPVRCPAQGWQKFFRTCIRYLPACAEGCEPLYRHVDGMSLPLAQRTLKYGESLVRQGKDEDHVTP